MRFIVGYLLATASVYAAHGQEFSNNGRDWSAPVQTFGGQVAAAKPWGDDNRVGDYGDLHSVSVRGARSFTANAIKATLFADPWLLLAAHPAAPREGYLRVLRQRVQTGYLHLGFPDATVNARIDGTFAIVSLCEGSRYLCGDVRVTGAKNIPVDRLIGRLTGPRLPADAVIDPDDKDEEGLPLPQRLPAIKFDAPVWAKGKPAPFDALSQQNIYQQVKADLADLGYHFPKFTAKVAAQPARKTAELVVQITDQGPSDEIDEIEVSGHHRDTMQQILDYLKTQPGMRFDQAQRARIERLLWQSGRYAAYKLTPVERGPGEGIKLQLDLTEYPRATPISKELSREERTLLKTREWLTQLGRGRSDIVISRKGDGARLEFVISPQRGCLALVRDAGGPDGIIRGAFVLTERQIGYYNLADRRKIVVPLTAYQLYVALRLVLNDADLYKRPFWLTFGAGLQPREKAGAGEAVNLKISAAPAYFVALGHEYDAEFTWKGHRLVVARSAGNLEIDESTGRVIQCGIVNDDYKPAGSVTFVDGAFQRQMRTIEQASAGSKDAIDPRRPIGSFVKACWNDEPLWKLYQYSASRDKDYNPEVLKQVRQIGRLLLDHGVLDPLDEWFVASRQQPETKEEEEFDIPGVVTQIPWDLQKLWPQLPRLSLMAVDGLFPRNSWPWTLWREATLAWANHAEYTSYELQRLAASPDMGPLGRVFTARLLRLYHLPGYQAMAAEGLRHLGAADFRRDCRVLLAPDRVPATVVHRAAEMLRKLDAKEVEVLARPLLKDRAALLEDFAQELRAHRDKPIAEALDAMLDHYWETTLRPEAEALLREMAEKKP
jgi:hypothetical protein